MNLFKELAILAMATEATPLRLDTVEFWIDGNDLVYFPATNKWNPSAMGTAVAQWSKVEPSVKRIVSRYAIA